MTLVLIDDAGVRSAPLAALGGTVVVGRSEAGHAAADAAGQALDRADLAFEPGIVSDQVFLRWVAGSGSHAMAELSVGDAKPGVVYRLSSIVSPIATVTQSADGAGQVSLVIAADHARVGTVEVN